MSLFNRDVAFGCAEEGGEIFFVKIRYDEVARHVKVLAAEYGNESNVAHMRALAQYYGLSRVFFANPVWVPVKTASLSQLSDVRIVGIDDGDGTLRGRKLEDAMETQLKRVEADQTHPEKYVRTLASANMGGKMQWIGGSIPRETEKAAFDAWRKRHFRKPCVASRHVALANLFLALHPGSAKSDGVYRILTCWQRDIDIFCLMRGNALVECRSTASPADTVLEDHFKRINQWAAEFGEKYGLTQNDLRVVVVSGSVADYMQGYGEDDPLSFWTIPWGESVEYASSAFKSVVGEHPDLALRAIGLALHGV